MSISSSCWTLYAGGANGAREEFIARIDMDAESAIRIGWKDVVLKSNPDKS